MMLKELVNERYTPFTIGIAGGSCSGKSYLCKYLLEKISPLKCLIIPMDHYYRDLSYLSPPERHRKNFDHPDALDYKLFFEHLKILISGGKVSLPFYDFHSHTRSISKKEISGKGKVLLVDGIFALYWPKISQLFDMKVFIDLDEEICFRRRVKRDIRERGRSSESVKKRYYGTVFPMYETYIAPTKVYADITIRGEASVEESGNRIVLKMQSSMTVE